MSLTLTFNQEWPAQTFATVGGMLDLPSLTIESIAEVASLGEGYRPAYGFVDGRNADDTTTFEELNPTGSISMDHSGRTIEFRVVNQNGELVPDVTRYFTHLTVISATSAGNVFIENKETFDEEVPTSSAANSAFVLRVRKETHQDLNNYEQPFIVEFSQDGSNFTEIPHREDSLQVVETGAAVTIGDTVVRTYDITIPAVTEEKQGTYRVRVTKPTNFPVDLIDGQPDSVEVIVANNPEPRFTLGAINATLTSEKLKLSVIASISGNIDGTPEYQWQWRQSSANDWQDIPGATDPAAYEVQVNSLQPSDEKQYRLTGRAHRVKGRFKKNEVSKTSAGQPSVYELRLSNIPFRGVAQIGDAVSVLQEGDLVQLEINVPDQDAYSISWDKDGVPLPSGVFSYEIASLTPSDSGNYRATVRHLASNEVREYTYSVTVEPTPVEEDEVTESPTEETQIPENPFNTLGLNLGQVNEGDTITISNTISHPADSYQWYHRDASDNETPIPGQTDLILNLVTTPAYNHKFFLQATYLVNGQTIVRRSDVSEIKQFGYRQVSVDLRAQQTKLLAGETLTIDLDIQNDDEFTQVNWYHRVDQNAMATELEMARNQRTLTISPVAVTDSGLYYAEVTRFTSGQRVTTMVTVRDVPQPRNLEVSITSPQDLDQANHIAVDFSNIVEFTGRVANGSENTKYQWRYQRGLSGPFIDLPGATSINYRIEGASSEHEGSYVLYAYEEDGSNGTSQGIMVTLRSEEPPIPEDNNMSEENTNQNTTEVSAPTPLAPTVTEESGFVLGVKASLKNYVNAMYANKRIDPRVGLRYQVELYSTILRVIKHDDPGEFMRAMDAIVDTFYEYRYTVFAPAYRARFLEYANANEFSQDAQETFMEFVNAFSWMAYPNNDQGLPWVLNETKDIIGNGVLFARFVQYYDRKLATALNADGTNEKLEMPEGADKFGDELDPQ